MANVIDNFISGCYHNKAASAGFEIAVSTKSVIGLHREIEGALNLSFNMGASSALDAVGSSTTVLYIDLFAKKVQRVTDVSGAFTIPPVMMGVNNQVTAGKYWREQGYPSPPYKWSPHG